jgi:hypothetical protein
MLRFAVTFFDDVFARTLREEMMGLADLAALIGATRAPTKDRLPLLKLARFGAKRTKEGSLRCDRNVLAVSGIELDHDAGSMPVAEAKARLDAAELPYLVYTTPSHRTDAPRWRVLLPFSAELPPKQRVRMVDRANGLLGGCLARESWALSQAFYYGRVG